MTTEHTKSTWTGNLLRVLGAGFGLAVTVGGIPPASRSMRTPFTCAGFGLAVTVGGMVGMGVLPSSLPERWRAIRGTASSPSRCWRWATRRICF